MRVDTSLSASTLLSAVGSPAGSAAVLASVILIHEAGHYLAAKRFGISVEEFSVGVGPKIFGFKAFGDEFNLRAIPLGGFVRFPENYNSTAVMELQEAAMDRQIEVDEEKTSALSGLMNALTFGRLERKRQEERLKRVHENESKSKWWNEIFSEFGFSKSAPEPKREQSKPKSFDIEYYDDPNLLQNRPWPQRAVVLSGGVVFNILLAFCIFFGEIHFGNGLPKPVFEQGAVVSSLPRQESAAKGILEAGDIIVSVNGE
jgi:membrane-associated protease RseP (regulator of RpoE activity)